MTAKQQAMKDIKNDLKAQGKSFLPFRKELNRKMQELEALHSSMQNFLSQPHVKTHSQLMATCFFGNGKVKYKNYKKYYEEDK